MLTLGDEFPNFSAQTTYGQIDFHEWLENSWGVLFSHPADFTPVCTTELARVVKLMAEFRERDVKVIALSCDSLQSHKEWIGDILHLSGNKSGHFPYPIIDDSSRELATMFGMLSKENVNKEGLPLSVRALFIIDPKKKFRLSILYPANVGRNFEEVLRAIDALQLTEQHKVCCPADWKDGDHCIVAPSVTQEEAEKLYPRGIKTESLPSKKNYLRIVPQP